MGASPRSVTEYGPSSSQQYHLYGTQYDDGREDYTEVMIPMTERIRDLSMAYALTGEDKYAREAIENIDYFMLDEDTGMEPNVVHGGDKAFYPEPHITIPAAIYGASFLKGHPAWGSDGRPAESEMESWVQDWRQSLEDNVDNSGVSGVVDNNIYTWYLVDRMASSAYLQDSNGFQEDVDLWKNGVSGDSDKAGALDQATNLNGDIVLEHEIGRGSDGEYHYSMYGMKALTLSAQIAHVQGTDLYTYEEDEGLTLQDVYDWHAPYVVDPSSWPSKYTQTRDTQSDQMEGAVALEIADSRWPGRYSSELSGLRPVYGNRVVGWTELSQPE